MSRTIGEWDKRAHLFDVHRSRRVPDRPTFVSVVFALMKPFEVARTREPVASMNPTSIGAFEVLSCAWLTRISCGFGSVREDIESVKHQPTWIVIGALEADRKM